MKVDKIYGAIVVKPVVLFLSQNKTKCNKNWLVYSWVLFEILFAQGCMSIRLQQWQYEPGIFRHSKTLNIVEGCEIITRELFRHLFFKLLGGK